MVAHTMVLIEKLFAKFCLLNTRERERERGGGEGEE